MPPFTALRITPLDYLTRRSAQKIPGGTLEKQLVFRLNFRHSPTENVN